MFLRRKVIEQCGGYDESFRYWGYLDWFFRIVKSGYLIKVVPEQILITGQAPESDSIQMNGSPRWIEEWNIVQNRHNNMYGRLFHKMGGNISWSPKRLVSLLFILMTGKSPRYYYNKIVGNR